MNSHSANSLRATGRRNPLVFTLILTMVFLALGFLSPARTNAHLAWTFVGVAAFLLAWQAWLFAVAARKAIPLSWDFAAMPSHYVQALVQLTVYACWGWYWRNVWAQAPLILAQVAFLYVFDALLTWTRRQTWRLGFGPWPIIFSTNLFLWFRNDYFVFQFVMVAMGVLGKHFIRWQRGGKLTHIFNPSAFGLTVVSLVLILTGTTDYTWGEQIASSQDRTPHLFTEIFLGGLVVQYLFSVTLLTFSAAATLTALIVACTKITGVYLFINTNISVAVFLGLHLLMTDPATTPRSSLGKIMFGSLYGGGVILTFVVLSAFHVVGFYDKLLVVPVLNLLTPLLDRLAGLGVAGQFGRWEAKIGPRKMNLAYMGCWAALFAGMVATGFAEARHPGATLAFWKKAAEEKRPGAAHGLRMLLDLFDYWDRNPDEGLTFRGDNGLSRQQKLGLAYSQVASIYSEGKLVPADHAKAAFYFKKACELGDVAGGVKFAIDYFRTNPQGAQKDIDRVLSVLEQSGAASTDGRVCYILGFAYNIGRGRPLDKAKARQFFEKGAVLGESAAWHNLALMELRGEGGPPDHAAAALWFQKSAEANNGLSCLYLAQMYLQGDGVGMDKEKAVAMLEKACHLGEAEACEILKTMGK
jgi:TPR repeat protein